MPSIIIADVKDFQKAGWNPEKMTDYKALYEQSQVKISQLEQERDCYKMDIEELKKELDEKQEELNEESQERLKNKECWMSVKDKYWEVRKENEELTEKITCLESDSHNEVSIAEYDELKEKNEELKKENERLERLRITFIDRYGELKKIVCPDSQFQDHKRIREGCLKLKWEHHKQLEQNKQNEDVMEQNEELRKELEKMKAFLGELRINVVKKD